MRLSEAASFLLEKHNDNRLEVALALLDGKLRGAQTKHVDELLDNTIRWAAEVIWKQRQAEKI